jgi:hypothetical protein
MFDTDDYTGGEPEQEAPSSTGTGHEIRQRNLGAANREQVCEIGRREAQLSRRIRRRGRPLSRDGPRPSAGMEENAHPLGSRRLQVEAQNELGHTVNETVGVVSFGDLKGVASPAFEPSLHGCGMHSHSFGRLTTRVQL